MSLFEFACRCNLSSELTRIIENFQYVFPLAAAATATIRYADALESNATVGLAAVMIVLAISALLIVLLRMTLHIYLVTTGDQQWRDPVFKIEMYKRGLH